MSDEQREVVALSWLTCAGLALTYVLYRMLSILT